MANTKLPARLLDTSAVPALNVTGDLTVDTTTLKVDSSNNRVGIGTTSPGASLHVAHGSDTSDLAQFSGGHTGRYLAIRSFQNNSLDGAGFIFNASSSGGAFKFQTATTDRVIIDKDGNVGIGDTSPSAIRLSIVTPTANNIGLQVENSNTADSFGMVVKGGNDANDYTADFRKRDNTSIMRILGSGNVGIGTGAPNGELEVNKTNSGGLGGRIVIRNGSSTSGSYCRLYLSPTANDPETRGTLIQAENVDGNNNMAMVFKVSAGASPAEHMRINQSGDIGIGTNSPSHDVHIKRDASETALAIQSNVGGSGSAVGGRLRLQLGAQTNTGSGAADTQAGDILGQIMFEGQGTDYSYQGGNIKTIVTTGDGDDGRSNQGTAMTFETLSVGSVSPVERMRIASDGVITYSTGPSAGAVGTYALLWRVDSGTGNSFGDTLAGSNLRAANTYHNGQYSNFGYGSTSVSGTWRCMGNTGIYNGSTAYSSNIWIGCTIWVRIS